MEIEHLDHLVLTVTDLQATCAFYRNCGMQVRRSEGRTALHFGTQKINLHEQDKELEPKAHLPTPGSADLCFILSTPIDKASQVLEAQGIDVIEGPVERKGALGPLLSIYVRDPDQNLIEFANYI